MLYFTTLSEESRSGHSHVARGREVQFRISVLRFIIIIIIFSKQVLYQKLKRKIVFHLGFS